MPNDWIVVLEVAVEPEGSVGTVDVVRLIEALGGAGVVGLASRDRYAVQLGVNGESCGDALKEACSRWARALRDIGLPPSDVVRAEVLTLTEFDREGSAGV